MKLKELIMEKRNKPKVFLGGTCNDSTWRAEFIKDLEMDYFNPVVEDWTEECMAEEIKQREECDYCLYVITSDMTGVYSIAEVIDDSNKRPEKTIFAYKQKGFDKFQQKSLNQVGEMVTRNGGLYLAYDMVVQVLNRKMLK